MYTEVKAILDDYQNLKPWVKEGIVHRIGQPGEPRSYNLF